MELSNCYVIILCNMFVMEMTVLQVKWKMFSIIMKRFVFCETFWSMSILKLIDKSAKDAQKLSIIYFGVNSKGKYIFVFLRCSQFSYPSVIKEFGHNLPSYSYSARKMHESQMVFAFKLHNTLCCTTTSSWHLV
jgi:hypothetical protein